MAAQASQLCELLWRAKEASHNSEQSFATATADRLSQAVWMLARPKLIRASLKTLAAQWGGAGEEWICLS